MARKSAPKAGTHAPKDPNAKRAKSLEPKKEWGLQPAGPSVDDYIAECDEKHRDGLVELRALILDVVPDATESIQRGFPFYESDGPLCGFASRSGLISFYLMNQDVLDAHRKEFPELELEKGCIRSKRFRDFPLAVLRTMLTEAAAKNAGN